MLPIPSEDRNDPVLPIDAPEPDHRNSTDETPPQSDGGCGPEDLAGAPTIYMNAPAYSDTLGYLSSPEHGSNEAGGMLVGPKDNPFLVTEFIPDHDAQTTVATYRPSASWFNRMLKKYIQCGMDAKGLAHKHPDGCTRPSYGDLLHVHSTFGRAKNSGALIFFMPIVCGGRLYPWLITRDEPDRIQLAKLVII